MNTTIDINNDSVMLTEFDENDFVIGLPKEVELTDEIKQDAERLIKKIKESNQMMRLKPKQDRDD